MRFAMVPCPRKCGAAVLLLLTLPMLAIADAARTYYFRQALLPPQNSLYESGTTSFSSYVGGNYVLHGLVLTGFSASVQPPDTTVMNSYSGTAIMRFSFDSGATFNEYSAPFDITVQTTYSSSNGASKTYSEAVLAMSISGGTLPAGIMIRESPTLSSTGCTVIATLATGCTISSFFDVFTELSTDGGGSWFLASGSGRLCLSVDPESTVGTVRTPSPLVLPLSDELASADGHGFAEFAMGVVLRNVSARHFSAAYAPPALDSEVTRSCTAVADMEVSTDGGSTFLRVRVPLSVSEKIRHARDIGDKECHALEMVQFDMSGGDLSYGVMFRESPTLVSPGQMRIDPQADDFCEVSSFFDVLLELSTDGGLSWQLSSSGPCRLALADVAPHSPMPAARIPPGYGSYSNVEGQVRFASGVRLAGMRFGSMVPAHELPGPGAGGTCTCDGTAEMMMSTDGGLTYLPVSAPATLGFSVDWMDSLGAARYYETKMLTLNISGGDLSPGVVIRESPTKESSGRYSCRAGENVSRADSFFDVFLEVSTDGGLSWMPAMDGRRTFALQTARPWIWFERGTGDVARVNWPDPPGDYVLQQTTNLVQTSCWTRVSDTPAFTNGERSVSRSVTNSPVFFRTVAP